MTPIQPRPPACINIERQPKKPQNNIARILGHFESTVPPGNAVVYYAFSSKVSADYTGQSKHFTTRMRRETSDARKALHILKNREHKQTKNLNKLQKTMARSGPETWYHLPIRILGTHSSIQTRLKNETQIIAWLHPRINRQSTGQSPTQTSDCG